MGKLIKTRKIKNFKALSRAASVTAAVLVIVGGVTFAALQSQQVKLTGNTIQTATANLQISHDGSNYASSQTGFTFSNIIPGGAAVPQNGHAFFLKNSGSTPVALKFAVSSAPSNPDNVDLSKVNVLLTPNGGAPQSFTLQALVAASASGGLPVNAPSQLFAGNNYLFTIQVNMTADAVNGASANIGNIDFAFTGTVLSS